MSTPNPILNAALAGVPTKLRTRLVDSYEDLKRNYLEDRVEAAGLSAGKFCELCLRVIQEDLTGTHLRLGRKIPNFADECRKLGQLPKTAGLESKRLLIPRALLFMYSIRNKRGIGHVGGDVEANKIDGATIGRMADWIVCELIRIHQGVPLEDAQALVDNLAVRQLPVIWEVGGAKRVLNTELSAADQTLLLLYSSASEYELAEDLFSWVEYYRYSSFKEKVLIPLHKKRFIEYNREIEAVYLSPSGSVHVEHELIAVSSP